MGTSWTREQQQVIDVRDRNILVSAAAGSGKTAVLVERIIKRITEEHGIDIDRMLVVTFTNAAAAEMRERIGAAIERALEENPDNEHLQRQLTLIHNAQITTIDSFCLYLIRNHFHKINLEPNFRIGDEGELKLLKQDVIKKVLLHNYEEGRPEFQEFADSYAPGRSDAALEEMILSVFEFSRSYPWPKEWRSNCIKGYETEGGLEELLWMKPLIAEIRSVFRDLAEMMHEALKLTLEADGPSLYEKVIRSDLEKYEHIASLADFSNFGEAIDSLVFDRLPSSRGYDGDLEKLELVKSLRNEGKDAVKKLKLQYFFCPLSVMEEQLKRTGCMAKELVRLADEFSEAFEEDKRKKNLVDFHDLEHFALEILVDKETKCVRDTVEEFRDMYEEIMIDEYQDSNYVQETILRAISREERGQNNLFMVGDVKQSIYRFRLARPELFMEKYDRYSTEESSTQRIDLHKNFRSREEVLSCANDIFYRIMKKDLGNVAYDSAAALYPGASYPAVEKPDLFAPELLLTDSSDALFEDTPSDKKLLEAKMVAHRIRALKKTQVVTDKKTGELRAVQYSDIVILLRSLSGWAEQFASVLNDAGIPAHAVSATGYFSATEVQTVLSMLRILDNPRQDIPLAAVLRSPIVGMTDEELAKLRTENKKGSFSVCVLNKRNELSALVEKNGEEALEKWEEYERKLWSFFEKYQKLRALVPDTPIHELIEILLRETGYGNYAAAMPAGERRRANLLMLIEKAIAYENTSYKGLFHFVRYIDELRKYQVDFGEADMVGENEDVVRIMSIHKSKGLEFPVVFVCGLGKNFNRRDTRSRMVLHPDYGIGLDFMDGERRMKGPTIAKKSIAKQIDLENLGEELRVLYVALTRAKEKLILTGTKKQIEQELKKASAYTELSYLKRESASGYLDWILPAFASYKGKYTPRVITAAELVDEEIKEQFERRISQRDCLCEIENANEAYIDAYEECFSFEYPYSIHLARKNKYSVSELKHRAMREKAEQEQEQELIAVFPEEVMVPYIPAFVRRLEEGEEEINQGALRGTAVHRVMECYRFAGGEDVCNQIQQMLSEGKLSANLGELVDVSKVQRFVESETGQRMCKADAAGALHREKPFVMGFSGTDLKAFGFEEIKSEQNKMDEDLTLIQGIIDVFWMEEDGIVLLDYKTDRIERPEQLIERYHAQLQLYAEALERIYNREGERQIRVKEKLLYSFCLGCVIPV
ncbi:MAG: helicase-exonuclease AddAB subunit AddA [Roseburia sp.]